VAVFRLLPLRLAERVFPGELLTVVDTDLRVVVGLADLPVVVGLADLPVAVDMAARPVDSAVLPVAVRLLVASAVLPVAAVLLVDLGDLLVVVGLAALLAVVTAAMAVLPVAARLLVDSAALPVAVLPVGLAVPLKVDSAAPRKVDLVALRKVVHSVALQVVVMARPWVDRCNNRRRRSPTSA
jgi:hypothetical protein